MEDVISPDGDTVVCLGLEGGALKASTMEEFMALSDNTASLGFGRGGLLHMSKIKKIIAPLEGVVTGTEVHGIHCAILLQQEALPRAPSQALVNIMVDLGVHEACIIK